MGQIPVEKESIETVIQGLANLGPTLSIVALLGTIWTAGALSASIRSALGVAFEEERGRPLLRSKLIDYAVLPVLGVLLIGGVVVTESVFNIPGLGRLTVDSVLRRDYPVIQGIILVFSAAYVLVNLAVDLLYTVFDPRIRY